MKKWSIPVALLVLLTMVYVGYRAGASSMLSGVSEPTEEIADAVHAEYPTISTLTELTQQAPVVAVGTITGVAGTRNLARDPKNPKNPDPTLEITGVDYRFEVDQFLKGSAPSTILVTEAKSVTFKGEKPVLYEGFKEMPPGGRYILFLRETTDGSGRWIGVAQPWRFALRGSKVSVESKWDEAQARFPMSDESEFIAQVRAYAGQR